MFSVSHFVEKDYLIMEVDKAPSYVTFAWNRTVVLLEVKQLEITQSIQSENGQCIQKGGMTLKVVPAEENVEQEKKTLMFERSRLQ